MQKQYSQKQTCKRISKRLEEEFNLVPEKAAWPKKMVSQLENLFAKQNNSFSFISMPIVETIFSQILI